MKKCKTNLFGSFGNFGRFRGFLSGFFTKKFGELAQWFYDGATVDENGRTYSLQGDEIRPLISDSKVQQGNDSFHGVIADMPDLQWDYFYGKTVVQKSPNVNTYYLDTRSSGMNGFALLVRSSSVGSNPDSIQVLASDDIGLKQNIQYPEIDDGDTVEVIFDTRTGNTVRTVLYNGVPQNPIVETTDDDLVDFSATINKTDIYVGRYHLDDSLGEFETEIVDLFIGNAAKTFSHYPAQESGYLGSYDVLGNSSNIVWTDDNWQTPTLPISAWNNTVGYNKYFYHNGTTDWVEIANIINQMAAASEFLDITNYFYHETGTATGDIIIGLNTAGGGNVCTTQIETATNFLRFFDGNSSTFHPYMVALTNETWYKVRTFINLIDDTVQIYLNDVEVINISADIANVLGGLTDFSLGQEYDGGAKSDFFNGFLHLHTVIVDGDNLLSDAILTAQDGAEQIYIPAKNKAIDAVGTPLLNGAAKYPVQASMYVPKGDGATINALLENFTAYEVDDDKGFEIDIWLGDSALVSRQIADNRNSSTRSGFMFGVDAGGEFQVVLVDDAGNTKSWLYFDYSSHVVDRKAFRIRFEKTGFTVMTGENFENLTTQPFVSKPLDQALNDFTCHNEIVFLSRHNNVNYIDCTISDFRSRLIDGVDDHHIPMTSGFMRHHIDAIGGNISAQFEGVTRTTGYVLTDKCGFVQLNKGFTRAYISNGTNWAMKFSDITIALGKQLESADTLVIEFWYALIQKTGGASPFFNIIWSLDQPESDGCIRIGHDNNSSDLYVVQNTNMNWLGADMDDGVHRFQLIFNDDSVVVNIFNLDGSLHKTDTFDDFLFTSLNTELDFWIMADPSAGGAPTDVPMSWATLPHLVTLNGANITNAFSDRFSRIGLQDGLIPASLTGSGKDVLGNKIQFPNNGKIHTDEVQFNFNPENAVELGTMPKTYEKDDSLAGVDYADKRIYFESEDRFMYGQTDEYQNTPGYDEYMADQP